MYHISQYDFFLLPPQKFQHYYQVVGHYLNLNTFWVFILSQMIAFMLSYLYLKHFPISPNSEERGVYLTGGLLMHFWLFGSATLKPILPYLSRVRSQTEPSDFFSAPSQPEIPIIVDFFSQYWVLLLKCSVIFYVVVAVAVAFIGYRKKKITQDKIPAVIFGTAATSLLMTICLAAVVFVVSLGGKHILCMSLFALVAFIGVIFGIIYFFITLTMWLLVNYFLLGVYYFLHVPFVFLELNFYLYIAGSVMLFNWLKSIKAHRKMQLGLC